MYTFLFTQPTNSSLVDVLSAAFHIFYNLVPLVVYHYQSFSAFPFRLDFVVCPGLPLLKYDQIWVNVCKCMNMLKYCTHADLIFQLEMDYAIPS